MSSARICVVICVNVSSFQLLFVLPHNLYYCTYTSLRSLRHHRSHLLVTCPRVGLSATPQLFGLPDKPPLFSNTLCLCAGNNNWLTDVENAWRPCRTRKIRFCAYIACQIVRKPPSLKLRKQKIWNFGPSTRAGPSAPTVAN